MPADDEVMSTTLARMSGYVMSVATDFAAAATKKASTGLRKPSEPAAAPPAEGIFLALPPTPSPAAAAVAAEAAPASAAAIRLSHNALSKSNAV